MKLDPTNSEDEGLNFRCVNVNVPDLISIQKNIFLEILNNVIKTLREEEVEHRKKFASKKLAGVFSGTTYLFEKIFAATSSTHSDHVQLVDGYIDRILECVEVFKNGLKERGEPDDNITDTYENLDYTLQHIKAFLMARSRRTFVGKMLIFSRALRDDK